MNSEATSVPNNKALDKFVGEFAVINALADRNRQKIITLLFENKNEGMTVTEITRQMTITQPAVSHHLKILRETQLVAFKKRGLQSLYYLTLEEPLANLETVIHELRMEF
ncbi:ArsR/SmtB family transcription factor [Ligilactobacillus ceti]|nr:metalloregulator ArsR/SmtB family transcription factor [Ligilactobacillus ceti]